MFIESMDLFCQRHDLPVNVQRSDQSPPVPASWMPWSVTIGASSEEWEEDEKQFHREAKLAPSYHFPTQANNSCSSQCKLLLQEGLFAICEPDSLWVAAESSCRLKYSFVRCPEHQVGFQDH